MENNNKEFENRIRSNMALEAMELNEPGISLVEDARKKILLRKKPVKAEKHFLHWLFMIFQSKLKFYQVGFSVLLTTICLIYSLEINNNTGSNRSIGADTNEMVAANNPTISVNSSTLLTSIPTLIIRN